VGFFDKVKATASSGAFEAQGGTYLAAGEVERAEEAYRAAADAVRQFGLSHPPVRAKLWNHAISLVYVGRFESARLEFQSALLMATKAGTESDVVATWDNPDATASAKSNALALALEAVRLMRNHSGKLGTILDPQSVLPVLIRYDREHGHVGEAQGYEAFLAAIQGRTIGDEHFSGT
jgi:hypothetical protein